MSDMLHIARGGILASRTALAVTAENVANVGTEGYRRRQVTSVAASGGQTTPQTRPTGGQGVSVTEVRRAFDHLIAERSRAAVMAQASSAAHLGVAAALETRLIPGETGLDGRMRDFLDSLSRLAASPADMTTRSLALSSAASLAQDITDIAGDLVQLRRDTFAQAGLVAGQAQGLLESLEQLNNQMAQIGEIQTAGQHPLADRRDALLSELAGKLPISVALQADGRAFIRLGSEAGPALLDRQGPARLSVNAADRLTLHIATPTGEERETRMLGGGQLGGLSLGLGAIDMARAEFDQLTRNAVDSLNQLHRSGIDLTGQAGQDLFHIDGWLTTFPDATADRVHVQVTLSPPQTLNQPLELVFDGLTQEWQARDQNSAVLASGRDQVILPGVTIALAGAARDGDRLSLHPVSGRAVDLRLALSDPRTLAAASQFNVAPAASNSGAARLQASLPSEVAFPGAVDLIVTDAAAGVLVLRDVQTGATLDEGQVGADGQVLLGGFTFHLAGSPQTGDSYTLRATSAFSGNGDVAQAMAALRRSESGTGLLEQLSRFQGDLGIRTAAAQRNSDTAQARLESAQREESALGGVNLDVEAARMVELQQAYQASAQAMSVARSLFETLLRMI